MNNNEPARVEGYEVPVDVLLEDGEEVSAAALVAAETLSDRDEFDSLAKGEEFLGGLSQRVAAPSRTPVDFAAKPEPACDEGGFDLPDIFAAPTQREREHEDLLKSLQSSPLYQQAREQFVRNSTDPTPRLNFRKLRSPQQLKEWVKAMLSQGHSLESLVERARQGGDLRAAGFIQDAGLEVLAEV